MTYASLAIVDRFGSNPGLVYFIQALVFVQCEVQKYEDYIPISFYTGFSLLLKNIKYCPWLLRTEYFQIKVIVFAERIFQKSSDKLWHSGENPQTASNLLIQAQMGNIICIIEESHIEVIIFSHGTWKELHQKPFIIVRWYIFVNLSIPFPKDCVNLYCLIVCLFVCLLLFVCLYVCPFSTKESFSPKLKVFKKSF